MQGRETLEGERRARKLGFGESTFLLLFWRDNVCVGCPSPWAFLLISSRPVQQNPLHFCPKYLLNSSPPHQHCFPLCGFSFPFPGQMANAVPLHTQPPHPWSVGLVQAVPADCERMGEDEAWTTANVPELSALLWAPSRLSQRAYRFFFSN